MATVVVAPRSHRSKELRRHTLIYLGLTPFLVLAVFPILWMAITAIKQDADLYLVDAVPFWFRQAPTWKNFDFLFHNTSYGDWIVNTMLISFWVSAITLLTAVPAGYALARLRLPFAENLGIGIFMTYLVPAIILFIPLARVVSTLDLQDSWWSLVVVYPTFTIPFCTWLLMGFFKTVPFEIEEAAMVDGCGQLWRHLFLGIAHGGRAAGRRPGGDRLQPVPRQVHQRDHGSGNQMMAVNEQSIPGGVSMKRNGVAAVIACLTLIGLITPALAQAPAPAPQAKGVKSSTLVTSLGGFKETVSIPVVLSGQTVEIEPGGQTGRQRHLVPTFIYVLEGTLVTNSEGGRVGVAGAQYHAAGQSYSDPAGVWHNHSNPGPGPVKYLLLFLSTPGGDLTQKAGED